ncbi:MAG: hypothetical protein ACXW36_10610, partial [Nitrospira sp.]
SSTARGLARFPQYRLLPESTGIPLHHRSGELPPWQHPSVSEDSWRVHKGYWNGLFRGPSALRSTPFRALPHYYGLC